MSKASFEFVDVYSQVLLPFLEGYKQAKNEKNRAHFVMDAREAVLKSNAEEEDRPMNLPKDLKTVGVFNSLLLLTLAHSFRPYLAILKVVLRKQSQRRLSMLNLPKSRESTASEM
jgi:hypothetical protein